ncbi:MAG: hypothetical protein ABW224_16875, partial [Kibdelosporangium sp.]
MHHALRVRLTGPADLPAIADRLRAITSSPLWVEDIPLAAIGPLAERRRAIELSRAADRTRCVLLRYADGQADLVIVAPRDKSVRQLAAALLGLPSPSPQQDTPVEAAGTAAPEWGLGSGRGTATHHHALPLGTDMDEAAWRKALAIVLDHYGPTDSVGMLVDTEPGLPGAEYVPCLTPVFPLTISVLDKSLRCDFELSHF